VDWSFEIASFNLKFRLCDVLALAILLVTQVAQGAEYIQSEKTAPASVEELGTPVGAALKKAPVTERVILDKLKRRLEKQPAWLRDLSIDFNLRGYYFKGVNRDKSINETLTLGGELAIVTGRIADIARVGLSYYGSYGLYAPEDRGGTGLLGTDQENLGVLGQAYLKLGNPGKFESSLYRQTLELPYLNKNDSRMIPNTHEAYLAGRHSAARNFIVGHVTKIKTRTAENFVPMSVVAGAPESNKGVTVAGIKRDFGEGTNIGAFNIYGWDTFNTAYVEGGWVGSLARWVGIKFSTQFTDQRSVGEAMTGDFTTNSFGLSIAGDYHGRLLALAYTQTNERGTIRNPWGGSPLYNSMMLEDFDRAGEQSLRLSFSWSGKESLKAWSGFASVVTGWDAVGTITGAKLSDVNEYDVTLDYKPLWGKARGLWLRVRGAYADFEDDTDRWNVRLILNHAFNFL